MDRNSFRGIFVIVATPFTQDQRVDEESLGRTMDFCLAAGVHGVVANAMASEGNYLTETERKRAAEVVVGKAKGKVPVIVAVSAPHHLLCVEFAHHAENIGADAIMSLPPTMSPASPAEIKAHYTAIASATSLPLVIQNAGGVSALSAATIAELINENPKIRFVKEESGQPRTIGEINKLCGTNLEGVMGGGAGKRLMEELRHGGCGTMPACEIADVHVAVWNAIQTLGDREARNVFERLLPLLDLEISYGLPLIKEVLFTRGVISTNALRQSGLRPLDDAARAEAATIMDNLTDLMLPEYAHRRLATTTYQPEGTR